ncbi:MAG: hypothetical protein KY459_12350 [Acidobacteria bacterium]|nr:hypothetical protein [Acidobacteriota bacterium]
MSDEVKIEDSKKKSCARCGKSIDAMANRCPFCGADSRTGDRQDESEIVREVLSSRPPPSRLDRLISTLRERQGLALLGLTIVVGGALWLATVTVTGGSSNDVSATDAVPLPEVFAPGPAAQPDESLPMPELPYHFDGDPARFEQWLEEEGAVAPPPEEQRTGAQAARQTSPPTPAPAVEEQPTPAQDIRPATPQQPAVRRPPARPAEQTEPTPGTSTEGVDPTPETDTSTEPEPPRSPGATPAGSPFSG